MSILIERIVTKNHIISYYYLLFQIILIYVGRGSDTAGDVTVPESGFSMPVNRRHNAARGACRKANYI